MILRFPRKSHQRGARVVQSGGAAPQHTQPSSAGQRAYIHARASMLVGMRLYYIVELRYTQVIRTIRILPGIYTPGYTALNYSTTVSDSVTVH